MRLSFIVFFIKGLFFLLLLTLSITGITTFGYCSEKIMPLEEGNLFLLKKYIDGKALEQALIIFQKIMMETVYSLNAQEKETLGRLAIELSELCFLNERKESGLSILQNIQELSISSNLRFSIEEELQKRNAQAHSPEEFYRYLQSRKDFLSPSYMSLQDECFSKVLQEALRSNYDLLLKSAQRLLIMENYDEAYEKYQKILNVFSKDPVCFEELSLKEFFLARLKKDVAWAYLKKNESVEKDLGSATHIQALAGYSNAAEYYEKICKNLDGTVAGKPMNRNDLLDRVFLEDGAYYHSCQKDDLALHLLNILLGDNKYTSQEEKRAAFLAAKIYLQQGSYKEVIAIIHKWEETLNEKEVFAPLFLKGRLAHAKGEFFRAAQFLGRALVVAEEAEGIFIGEGLQLLGCTFLQLFLKSSNKQLKQDCLMKAGDVFFKAAKNHGLSEGVVGFAYVLRLKKEMGMVVSLKEHNELIKFFNNLSDQDRFWIVRQSLAGGDFLYLEEGSVELQAGRRQSYYFEETLIRSLRNTSDSNTAAKERLLNLTEELLFHFSQSSLLEPLHGIYQLLQDDLMRSLKDLLLGIFTDHKEGPISDYLEGIFAIIIKDNQQKKMVKALKSLQLVDFELEDRLFIEKYMKAALYSVKGLKAKAISELYDAFGSIKKSRYQLKLRLFLAKLGVYGGKLLSLNHFSWKECAYYPLADECFFLEYSFQDYMQGSEGVKEHLQQFSDLFPHSLLQPLVLYFLGNKEPDVHIAISLLEEALQEEKFIAPSGNALKGQAYFHYCIKELLAERLAVSKDYPKGLLQAVAISEGILSDFSLPNHPFASLLLDDHGYLSILRNVDYSLARYYLSLNEFDKVTRHSSKVIGHYIHNHLYQDPYLANIWRMLAWVFSNKKEYQAVVSCLCNADNALPSKATPFSKKLPDVLVDVEDDNYVFLSEVVNILLPK
ncbi:hypothetical protein [Candidatus Clavichlamydia salmonicola]|uniref:hypothetical protein n=1 Tax=Candidatus Clavichlamydia salmonicola TaxID=469812 RepID=UPI0018915842|nr:hypothetical protein [Candidatus Clavichlamydia salmonicola]